MALRSWTEYIKVVIFMIGFNFFWALMTSEMFCWKCTPTTAQVLSTSSNQSIALLKGKRNGTFLCRPTGKQQRLTQGELHTHTI